MSTASTHTLLARVRPYAPALVVLAVALMTWVPSLGGAFVWDDLNVIVNSDRLQASSGWWQVMVHPAMWVTGMDDGNVSTWRPLALAGFALEYRLFGLAPAGYHLTSVVLHACVSLGIFALARRFAFRPWDAAAIALLFAVHPAHVESVAWINGRSEVLALGFGMCALLAAAAARARVGWVAVFVLLAGMGKETGVVFGPGAVLVAWAVGHDRATLRRVAIGAAVGVSVWFGLRALVVSGGAAGGTDLAEVLAAVVRWPLLQARIAEGVLVPLQHGVVVVAVESEGGLRAAPLLAWLAVGGLTAGGVVLARRGDRVALVGWLWWLASGLPLIAIAFTSWPGLNRWLYIGLPGILLAGAAALRSWRPQVRRLARGFAVAAVLLGMTLSLNAQRYWASEIALYERTVTESPDVARGWFMLGLALAREGQLPRAAVALERGLALGQPVAGAHSVLTVVYAGLGRCEDARQELDRWDGFIERPRLVALVEGCVALPEVPRDTTP